MVPARDRALRLRSLWHCWFLALLLHTDLGLMPLFHGLPVEIASHLDPTAVVIFRVMLMAVMMAIGALINREALLLVPGSQVCCQPAPAGLGPQTRISLLKPAAAQLDQPGLSLSVPAMPTAQD